MARLGFRTINEMVGRSDRLEMRTAIDHWKAKGLDYSKILYRPKVGPEVGTYCCRQQDHLLERALDNTTLLELCAPAIERGEKVDGRAADRQHQPGGRHDHRGGDLPPPRGRRACPRTRST